MKIVHLCLGSFYIDNYSYQENLLPKFHKKMGHKVEIIASLETFNKDGNRDYFKKGKIYDNENGIKVTRLAFKQPTLLYRKMKRYRGLFGALKASSPDIIFIHGCQSLDVDQVVKFLKASSKKITVYIDNHCDFSNSARNFLSYNILHKIIWKKRAHLIEPYTRKFYGVLPARVDFLKNMYKLPEKKCDLLLMGADDEYVNAAIDKRKVTREILNIKDSDFLIITGGKIDRWKKETLDLMDAVVELNKKNLKLVVFGSIVPELRATFEAKLKTEKIKYVGWLNNVKTYDLLAASDLAVFPGRHSVLWEETTGLGIPMLCRHWEGTTDIDLDGNMIFLKTGQKKEIYRALKLILEDKKIYKKMKLIANEKGLSTFSYSNIAKQSLK